jgi:nucleoside-diphosphate-sugar epimerase
MRVNVEGTRNLLEACRNSGRLARFVFASSVAVYGGESVVEDRTPVTPLSSYGAEKVISEYLVRDYARKGFLDGRSLRLPTIIVRPGKPNKAASSFASSIIREPLTGKEAVCPVAADTPITVLSPRRCVDAMIHGHELPGARLGTERTIQLPAIGTTAGEMVKALRSIAGDRVADRVAWRPDSAIEKIVATWPQKIAAERTRELGFLADGSVNEIIEAFIEDELGGEIA